MAILYSIIIDYLQFTSLTGHGIAGISKVNEINLASNNALIASRWSYSKIYCVSYSMRCLKKKLKRTPKELFRLLTITPIVVETEDSPRFSICSCPYWLLADHLPENKVIY